MAAAGVVREPGSRGLIPHLLPRVEAQTLAQGLAAGSTARQRQARRPRTADDVLVVSSARRVASLAADVVNPDSPGQDRHRTVAAT